jgi:hypothetical protein
MEPVASEVFVNERVLSFFDNPENPNFQHARKKRNGPENKKLGNRVLMVGRLRELALYRAEVLRLAGFKVSIPADAAEALQIMRAGQFDAIVLTYTLASEEMEQLAKAAREYCPDCPVIAITDAIIPDRRIAPDATALANEGPAALVSALNKVLKAT